MPKKFAYINCVGSSDEIPVKFNLLKRGAESFTELDWYVQKYNPYVMEEARLLGEDGYVVKLPLTKETARRNRALYREIASRTLRNLRDYGVDILNWPQDMEPVPGIADARAERAFAFFAVPALRKSLALAGKYIKFAEVLIIDGEKNLTMNLIERIYPHVNYLTVLTDAARVRKFEKTAAKILSDTGLILRVAAKNGSNAKRAVKAADVAFDADAPEDFDFWFKRGGACFSLNPARAASLAAHRPDMFVADGLRVKFGDRRVNLAEADMLLYLSLKEYSALESGYNSYAGARVEKYVRQRGADSVSLTFKNEILYKEFTKKSR